MHYLPKTAPSKNFSEMSAYEINYSSNIFYEFIKAILYFMVTDIIPLIIAENWYIIFVILSFCHNVMLNDFSVNYDQNCTEIQWSHSFLNQYNLPV